MAINDIQKETVLDDMPAEPRIYKNILETMGNTPLVQLNRLGHGLRCQIAVKVEYFNPGGSVKDRIGITIIEDAEKQGLLKPGGRLLRQHRGIPGLVWQLLPL